MHGRLGVTRTFKKKSGFTSTKLPLAIEPPVYGEEEKNNHYWWAGESKLGGRTKKKTVTELLQRPFSNMGLSRLKVGGEGRPNRVG